MYLQTFTYFDLDDEPLRRRVAALSLLTLLKRCHKTLTDYLADQSIRGSYPLSRCVSSGRVRIVLITLSRIREEELVHVLRKLLTLRLWSGTLWAAFSESPSQYASEQPGKIQPVLAFFYIDYCGEKDLPQACRQPKCSPKPESVHG